LERAMLGKCPVCGGKMDVVRLHCQSCESTLEGRFRTCKFCQLNPEQQAFIEVFLKSRGNIKEVERELGISYPTVRGRLDAVLETLGYRTEEIPEEARPCKKEILEALERGELTTEEATKMLRQVRN